VRPVTSVLRGSRCLRRRQPPPHRQDRAAAAGQVGEYAGEALAA